MMVKNVSSRVWIAVVVVLVLVGLVGAESCLRYWRGVQAISKKMLRDATSIEFQLAQLHAAIEGLTPTLQQNRRTAAELDIELSYMQEDLVRLEEQQGLARSEMAELRKALDDKRRTEFEFDGRMFTRARVEEDLARRLEDYLIVEKQLQMRRHVLAKRQATLEESLARIRDNKQQKMALISQSESLAAELRMLEVAAATSNFDFENPQFHNAQQLAQRIEKRIRVLRKITDAESVRGEVPVNLDRRTAIERYDEQFARAE